MRGLCTREPEYWRDFEDGYCPPIRCRGCGYDLQVIACWTEVEPWENPDNVLALWCFTWMRHHDDRWSAHGESGVAATISHPFLCPVCHRELPELYGLHDRRTNLIEIWCSKADYMASLL